MVNHLIWGVYIKANPVKEISQRSSAIRPEALAFRKIGVHYSLKREQLIQLCHKHLLKKCGNPRRPPQGWCKSQIKRKHFRGAQTIKYTVKIYNASNSLIGFALKQLLSAEKYYFYETQMLSTYNKTLSSGASRWFSSWPRPRDFFFDFTNRRFLNHQKIGACGGHTIFL